MNSIFNEGSEISKILSEFLNEKLHIEHESLKVKSNASG